MASNLHPEIGQAVREVLERSQKPLSVVELCKQLTGPFKIPAKRKGDFLLILMKSAGGLYQWPKFRGSTRFWSREPESVAAAAAMEIAKAPTSISVLLRKLSKEAFGFPENSGKRLIADLVRDRRLYKDPPWGRTAKLTSVKPNGERYRKQLDDELTPILKKYAALGINPRALVDHICDNETGQTGEERKSHQAEVHRSQSVEQTAKTIMTVLERVEPQKGLVVAVRKIRESREFQGVSKEKFDEAVMHLFEERRVLLHNHSAPYTLTPEERGQLVFDGKGACYVGISWREPQPVSGVNA